MATALTTYFQDKLADCASLVTATATRLGSATAALAAAKAAQAADVAESARLDAAIAATRAALADPGKEPADIDGLNETLRADRISRRKVASRMLARVTEVRGIELRRDAFQTLSTAAAAARNACARETEAAVARGEKHTRWMSTETAEAIAGLVFDSQTLLNEIGDTPDPPAAPESEAARNRTTIAAARARIESDIPEVLLGHARARATRQVTDEANGIAAQVAHIEDARAAFIAAQTGTNGAAASAWLAYDRAEAALQRAATLAPQSFDRALALLRGIETSGELTDDQSDEIAAQALEADAPALVTEAELEAVRADIRGAERALENATLDALLADPVANPATNGGVQAAQAALDGLRGTPLADATAAHDDDLAAALDAWESAVPARAWTNLANYDTAIALLTDIAGTDLAARIAALGVAEGTLVTRLEAADIIPRGLAVADASVTTARDRAAHFADQAGQRAASALRGDA